MSVKNKFSVGFKNNNKMETTSLIYHISVMIIAIVMFFMKLTTPNAIFELFLKAVGKIVPLFCMLYAGIQIFKHFGII